MLVRPLMANFKMTTRVDCAVSACSPLFLTTKALAPHGLVCTCRAGGGVG